MISISERVIVTLQLSVSGSALAPCLPVQPGPVPPLAWHGERQEEGPQVQPGQGGGGGEAACGCHLPGEGQEEEGGGGRAGAGLQRHHQRDHPEAVVACGGHHLQTP